MVVGPMGVRRPVVVERFRDRNEAEKFASLMGKEYVVLHRNEAKEWMK